MGRRIIKRLPALAVLLLLCLIVYFYVDGWFDISFIVRGDSETTSASGGSLLTPPPSGGTDTSRPDDHRPGDVETDRTPETDEPAVTGPVTFPDADGAEGLSLSYGEWTPGGDMILAEASFGDVTAPNYFTSHKNIENEVSYVVDPDRGPDIVTYTPVEIDAPAVSLYMGYILVETDTPGLVNIYKSDFTPLGSFDPSVMSLAYCRDKDGRPLFTHGGAYYILNEEEGRFTVSDYDPELDFRGALFDYTPDYGTPREDDRQMLGERTFTDEYVPVTGTDDTFYVVPRAEVSFRPANSKGKTVGSRTYVSGYEYSDSLAAVVDAERHLAYISRSGSTVIKPSRTYTDLTIGRAVIEFYMEPLSNGPESIGFYFFDHGLTRIRAVTHDRSRYNRGQVYIVSDENIMIDKSGERFYIPLGYEVDAYSSGMILLHGEGGYGYMNYTGTWVVDPTLEAAEPFYEGLAVVKRGGEVALIDTAGNTVIPFGQFEYISNASTGVIAAYDGEWHILWKMAPAAADAEE